LQNKLSDLSNTLYKGHSMSFIESVVLQRIEEYKCPVLYNVIAQKRDR